MIEMHQDGDDEVVSGNDDDGFNYRPAGGLLGLVFSAPAMAIASLLIGFVGLGVSRSADVVGQSILFSSKNIDHAELTNLRGQALVQLVIAAIALVLALWAAVRVSVPSVHVPGDGSADAVDDGDPLWARALVGAAVLVAVVAVVVTGVSLIDAMHAHIAKQNLFGG